MFISISVATDALQSNDNDVISAIRNIERRVGIIENDSVVEKKELKKVHTEVNHVNKTVKVVSGDVSEIRSTLTKMKNKMNAGFNEIKKEFEQGGCTDSMCTFPSGRSDIFFLELGSTLSSPSEQYHLEVQENGNILLLCGHKGIWDTGTYGIPIHKGLALQGDGNIVLYRANGKNMGRPIWATGTNGRSGNTLSLQDDGNLVVYSSRGYALWASNTDGQC